jgi:hypothetical protein
LRYAAARLQTCLDAQGFDRAARGRLEVKGTDMMKLGMAAAAALLVTAGAYAKNSAEARDDAEADRSYEAGNEAKPEAEDAESRATERRSTLPPRARPRRDYTKGPRRPR